jgi:hypothetical protein
MFFKNGGIAFKMNKCRIARCDLFISLSEGIKRSGIYRRILAQYGEQGMTPDKKNMVTNHAIRHA